MVEYRQHFAVGACREREGTQRVGIVGGDNAILAGQPRIGGFCIGDALAVAAEVQLDHKGRNIVVALDGGDQRGERLPQKVGGTGTCRAGEDGGGDAFGKGFGVPACIKAAHAVTVQNHRHIGKSFVQQGVHRVQIVQQVKATVRLAVVTALVFGGTAAMPQMVVTCQRNAMRGVKLRHGGIALHIFAHTVAQLQHSPHGYAGHRVQVGGALVLLVSGGKMQGFAVEFRHTVILL